MSEFFPEPDTLTNPSANFWWVCQGESYEADSAGGYISSPKVKRNGGQNPSYANVAKASVGDFIVCYCEKRLLAIGLVTKQAVTSVDTERYTAHVKYYKLEQPIGVDEVPLEWRISEAKRGTGGPFNKNGVVNLGYLFPLSHDFAAKLARQFADRLPPLESSLVEGGDALMSNTSSTGEGDTPPKAFQADVASEATTDDVIPTAETVLETALPKYDAPDFAAISEAIAAQNLRLGERDLIRYHLSLKTRGFVILAGLSGTGKTWLAQAYADAVGADALLVPVAPNWTTNEDLLGYHNPLSGKYHDTSFSAFLRRAGLEHKAAQEAGQTPRPYHLILDEMNLARVEYYFARFLSAMEVRARGGEATIELAPGDTVPLPPNFFFVGTVNMDETTHSFADKVYDRAQLIELGVDRETLALHLSDAPHADLLLQIWDAVHPVAPFAFRVLDEIAAYIREADKEGIGWQEALDHQLLQKVLPRLKGTEPRVGASLTAFCSLTEPFCPLSHGKATRILEGYQAHGIASYF